ncbi:MAG: hypothetical protein KGL39_57075 [Patescibacteria group bacterium]|nr:hypothetical protein [Patescibacteria group bacterium]
MGATPQADIPGNTHKFHTTNASIASNGATSQIDQFVAPSTNAIKILAVNRIVQANEATHGTATTSATYRQFVLVNAGTSGTGTATLASLNQTASQAAGPARAFTLASTVTAPAGAVIQLQQVTVGGTDNDGTIVQAGSTDIDYQLL